MRKPYFHCQTNILWIVCISISILCVILWVTHKDIPQIDALFVIVIFAGGVGLLSLIVSTYNRLRGNLMLDELKEGSSIQVADSLSEHEYTIVLSNGDFATLQTWAWCPKYNPGIYFVCNEGNSLCSK